MAWAGQWGGAGGGMDGLLGAKEMARNAPLCVCGRTPGGGTSQVREGGGNLTGWTIDRPDGLWVGAIVREGF